MSHVRLTERFDHWNEQLVVDAENRLVKNVALAGQSSRNGYRYSEEALAAAAVLYDAKPVFLDHAGPRQPPGERSTRDLVGSVVNPHYREGRIRGDIRVLETPSGELFLKLVESLTPGVGMSHVVLAQRTPDGLTVERIADVLSVDVVINPATTSTFQESLNPTEARRDSAESSTIQLIQERDSLLERVQKLEADLAEAREQEQVRRLLADSGLPPAALTECFRRQVLQARTPILRQQLIEDRQQLLLLESRQRSSGRSQERCGPASNRAGDAEFLRVLKGR
jgi:hypothetical protein